MCEVAREGAPWPPRSPRPRSRVGRFLLRCAKSRRRRHAPAPAEAPAAAGEALPPACRSRRTRLRAPPRARHRPLLRPRSTAPARARPARRAACPRGAAHVRGAPPSPAGRKSSRQAPTRSATSRHPPNAQPPRGRRTARRRLPPHWHTFRSTPARSAAAACHSPNRALLAAPKCLPHRRRTRPAWRRHQRHRASWPAIWVCGVGREPARAGARPDGGPPRPIP